MLRRSVDLLFAGLQTFNGFRSFSLLTINHDIVLVTRQFADHTLTFSPHERIGRSLFKSGHYQRDLADRVLELLGDGARKTLLELGANIGTHSIYLTRGGRFDRLICVEPARDNLRLLRQNLALNDLSDRTIVVECAIGDHDGVVDFYFDETNFGGSSTTKPRDDARAVQVPLRRVDTLLKEIGASPDEIGLVWIDIEGAEPEAVQSMESLIGRRVPILLEFVPDRLGERAPVMAAYLAAHYGRCIVFDRKTEREMDIRELTSGTSDVLFLP